ncbi:NADP-specific glutamate dehydrogenase [hydrothermal vent metagenome]|uniref:NADP-specific glutamate dehydrogenase n=1 Tax=hydrothermal vent metagenome TaxID=652676 RepID=A0A3B1DIY0_9ZZZZ
MHIDKFMEGLIRRNPAQPEFHQAVEEVARCVLPFMKADKRYKKVSMLERMTEPDRIIIFRVSWEDDEGCVRANRGYRVQFNNAIGPYKGGLRFDGSVNLSVLKFLGFEQTFKNALTTLPMGGAKGGSNFNPKGKTDGEIMRFCQSFMTELSRHIGKNVDIPAGDIGCGSREISYLFGQYKRIKNEFTGTVTGKGLSFGGSPIRTEATGYGSVYFAREMLARQEESLEGKICLVSGAGNVSQFTAQKLIELGAKVVTLSDRSGFIYDPEGLTPEKLAYVMDLKTNRHGQLGEYTKEFGGEFYAGKKPWNVSCDLAFPSATQNEIHKEDAKNLIKNGCKLVCEGANMPTTLEGVRCFQEAQILYAPGKAANAGGVAISGLEMTQNSMRLTWSREEVDMRLQEIMRRIHAQCVEYGNGLNDYVDYVKGANIAGFVKVSEALLAYGIV